MQTGIRQVALLALVVMYLVLLSAYSLNWIVPDVWVLLGVHTGLSLAVLIAVRARIEHPATLFTFVFWFYAVGYPVVVQLGRLPDEDLTSFVLTLHTIGYLGFVLPTLVIKPKKLPDYNYLLPPDSINVLKIGIIVLIMLGILQILVSFATGSHKGGEWQYSILASAAPQLYAVVGVSILFAQWLFSRYKLPSWLLIFTLVSTLVPLIVTGRRTPGAIAVLVIIVLLEIRRRRLNLFKLTVVMLVGFVAFGVSKNYSTVLINDAQSSVKALTSNSWGDVIGSAFYHEFKSSGRITAASIEYGELHNFPTYGQSYLTRLSASFVPGFLASRNTNGIVHQLNIFITNGGTDTGLGYSMIAEGYNNFGIPGVFLNLFILGMIASALYRRAGRSPVRLASYAVFLLIVCSRVRSGTLSVYLMSIYSLLLPIGLFCLARLVMYGGVSDRIFLSRKRAVNV